MVAVTIIISNLPLLGGGGRCVICCLQTDLKTLLPRLRRKGLRGPPLDRSFLMHGPICPGLPSAPITLPVPEAGLALF